MRKELQDLMCQIREDLSTIGCMPEELIIILDNDQTWLEEIKRRVGTEANVKTISDKDQFKSAVKRNGMSRLILDILTKDVDSVQLAQEMNLGKECGSLVFMSSSAPPLGDLTRIKEMGAQFIMKDQAFEKMFSKAG